MFGRKHLAMVVMELTIAGLAIYTAITTRAVGIRFAAIGLLVAVLAVNAIQRLRQIPALRWVLLMALIAITGGADSPLQPFLLITTLVHAAMFGKRHALAHCISSMIAMWIMTLVHHPTSETYVRTITLMPLLLGAFFVGTWIRDTSDLMVRSSLEARDEILTSYGDRVRELQMIRSEMAHALKNPLASIKGLAGLIAMQPERTGERLVVLRREICRMQSIVEDYLSFSRSLIPITPEAVDVGEAVAEVARLHEGMASAKNITLDLSSVEPIEIVADRHKLKQMLVSLVVNAIEASAPGLAVELTCRRDGERAVVGVLDRGPGAPVDLLSRLCEPGLSTKEHGSGLGLTIARALAEQHGGALMLRNRDGGGFAAEIDLPVRCPRDRQLV
jgi:signal transduction histidine kinase